VLLWSEPELVLVQYLHPRVVRRHLISVQGPVRRHQQSCPSWRSVPEPEMVRRRALLLHRF
jgi:hypothetical protein